MPSRHLVDPELLPALDYFPTAYSMDAIGAIREALTATPVPRPEGLPVETTRVEIPTAFGTVGGLLHRFTGTSDPLPVILHIHGGGYVIGSAGMMEPVHVVAAADLRCAILSVDYALAPEAVHPRQVEECYAALAWLHDEGSAHGFDTGRIVVSGESAGGGLAAALAILARDRGEHAIAFQHLSAPMLDDRTCLAADPHPFAGDLVWTPESNAFGWSALLGRTAGSDGITAYAAPARAEDLSGLPPAFISVGALDLFLEEDMDYARRLVRAGVATEFHVYPGAYHGFAAAVSARVTLAADRDSRDALRRALHPDTPAG